MKKEIIITGKTVEEALAEGEKYAAEGELSYDILEMPKKGFLGIGGTPAKIKLTIDDGKDDADIGSIISDVKSMKVETDKGGDGVSAGTDAKASATPVKSANAENASKSGAQKPASAENAAKTDAPKPAQAKSADAPKPAAPAQKSAPANKAKPAEKKAETEAAKAPAPMDGVEKSAPADATESGEDDRSRRFEPVTDAEIGIASEFINTILRDLEIDAKAVAVKNDAGEYTGINIEGENTGALIGHHGETLDAVQYLANLSASRQSPTPNREFLKITVDIENYRAKREETLRALARRMADKAVKYRRNFVLEPMNPYERRIIHSEIQNIENVSTHSVGSDDNRKVVVTYEGADKVDRRRQRRPRHHADTPPTLDPVSPESFDID